jgi:hypothetical protein
MHDIDPEMMRLREVEARIALAEFHVREQEELVERLRAQGFDTSLADQMLETMRRALAVFRERQDTLLAAMCSTPAPDLPGAASDFGGAGRPQDRP